MGNTATQLHDQDQYDRTVLLNHLRDRFHWTTAGEINEAVGITPARVRQIQQVFPTLLISSQLGYKLVRNAVDSEIIECIQGLIHRSQKINERASALAGTL